MKNRHSTQQRPRGRPPLLFEDTVPGRICTQLGSLESISWRLRFGGENAHDLLQSAGFDSWAVSNERVRQIIEAMFRHAGKRNPLYLYRSHHRQWRFARFLRRLDGFQDEQKINSLARQLTNQHWINQATQRAGSLKELMVQLGIPSESKKQLRRLLQKSGIRIPKPKRTVRLRCRICHRTFIRSVSYERRFASQRKKGPLCGHRHSVVIS